MRAVAKFQFVSSKHRGNIDYVIQELDEWKSKKFARVDDSGYIIRRSRLPAQFIKSKRTIDERVFFNFKINEPVDGGNLLTNIKILTHDNNIFFQYAIALGSNGGLQIPPVDIRSPRFIKEVIDLGFDWRFVLDGEKIFSHCFNVDDEYVDELIILIKSEDRRLPVIVISELQGETIAGNIHEYISRYTCGLAHVCRLDSNASWDLTQKAGKEWSCYNGAVRLFWPFLYNKSDPRSHPLWTYDHIIRGAADEVDARERFIKHIGNILLEASTFVVDYPVFSNFESDELNLISEKRIAAREHGDYRALADSYAEENDGLKATLKEKFYENEILQQNIQALNIALRAKEAEMAIADSERLANDSPPQSVAEAVNIAKSLLKGKVEFGDTIIDTIESLNQTAGPPEKILRYLKVLGELSEALNTRKSLGMPVSSWLKQRNVECSGESETKKSNKEERRRRTFIINSRREYCDLHLKPSDGVSPDLCVRIYFCKTDTAPNVKVGYIGRHFE